jgi:hypothetical protein
MKRSKYYIATIPMKSEEQVIEVKKVLEQIFGWVTLRGRSKNRKLILGDDWRKHSQNDIPWRRAEYIDVYLHHANPNRNNSNGIVRQNTDITTTKNIKGMGSVGLGYYDVEKAKRSFKKGRYKTKHIKLQPGDWGYIAQELIDFVERQGDATHTELHNHYRKITNGSNSFSHCLANLRVPDFNRRCRRYIQKQGKQFCKGNYIVKHISNQIK